MAAPAMIQCDLKITPRGKSDRKDWKKHGDQP